ncbi:hypothetical protein GF380_01660 [Candidatus Uhrbacteria bacterium]|nr:hypothetical protein [Candidatus Uhrbacteria bacterium]
MAEYNYPSEVGTDITAKVAADLASGDFMFVGTDPASADPWSTKYSEIRDAITANPGGAIGSGTAATGLTVEGAVSLTGDSSLIGDVLVQDPTEASGGLTLQTATASSGALTGATDTIEVNIPSGSYLFACQLRVDVAVTDDAGDDTWSAEYNDGASLQSIVSGAAAAQNTKVNAFHDPNANTPVTDAETDIVLTPNGGNFSAGEITAVVYYLTLTSLDDVSGE